MIELILLGYQKRVGKDTLADMLCCRDGYMKFAFADKLKEIVSSLYGFSYEQMHDKEKELIDPRYNMTPRTMLQRFGTEAVREQVWQNTWIDYVLKQQIPMYFGMEQKKFVISDLRYKNEAINALTFGVRHMAKVRLIKVVRPDLPENTDSHSSELDLADFKQWDATINNYGSPENMYYQIKKVLG